MRRIMTDYWHLADGLLRLAQGLQQSSEDEADRRRGFARSVAGQTWPRGSESGKYKGRAGRR